MSIPRAKYNGSMREVQERAKERADWMAERHSGINFSHHTPNPLGVKEAKAMGMPGADYPSAIWSRFEQPMDDPVALAAVYDAWLQWRDPMTKYVRFTTIAYATGLGFHDIFGVINYIRVKDMHLVHFSVNRAGDCTVFRFDPKVKELIK